MKLFQPEESLVVVQVPACSLSAGFDSDSPLGILLDQVEGQTTKHGEVFLPVPCSHAAVILTESDVETPMQTVLDCPVRTCHLGESLCVAGKARNKVPSFHCDVAINFTF